MPKVVKLKNVYHSSKRLVLPARDQALEDVLARLSTMETTAISARSGVSRSTIYNWRRGKTRRPQHITMEFALRAMGLTFYIGKL